MGNGSVFTGNEWMRLAGENGVVLKFSGVQHHNGIGIGERYHAPLRNIYRKIEIEYTNMAPTLILKTAIKAMNDTIGPEGLVPSLLRFGVLPRYTPAGLESTRPNQRERLKATRVAKEEFFRISNGWRIRRALRSNVPQAADRHYKVGDLVRVHRQKIRGYTKPVPIAESSEYNRIVTIRNDKNELKPYAMTQIKPYEGFPKEAGQTIEKVAQALGPWCEGYWKDKPEPVMVTEVIEKDYIRASCPKMKDAIRKEVDGLMKCGHSKS